MAEPRDELAAGVGGHSHLRASHAEREQVIGLLKTAFVQERLAKDEFDLRVGWALTLRTCGELAALTADIPARLPGAQPPQAAREWSNKKVAAAVTCALGGWLSIVAAASFWVADSGPAQRSPGVGIVVILLHTSIIWVWLIVVWLGRRADRRSTQRMSHTGGGQESQTTVPSASLTAVRSGKSRPGTGSQKRRSCCKSA
jgi:hypothetical protein